MPFDRMVRAVDEWAASRGRSDIVAQIGETPWQPRSLKWHAKIDPAEFRRLMAEAEAVVSHAGMGTILTALELGTPILVMPRLASLQETRNDHQVATAERFQALGRVSVAMDEHEIPAAMDGLTSLKSGPRIDSKASPALIAAVRDFIFEPQLPMSFPQGQDQSVRSPITHPSRE